jgi:ATP-dependent RNA helicase RhlE
MQFEDLNLIEPLLRAVHAEGYTTPTPIQEQSIPHTLQGRDLLGCAQTGTGKTAAFALPILQYLTHHPRRDRALRVLVLAPTRELATQIGESFQAYGKFTPHKQVTIFGGVGQKPQIDRLQHDPEILVATPGRLLDLMSQGYVKLDRIEILVLDEADRMLDMGFIHDVRRIIAAVPRKRQTLFFSATMPPEIQSLADNILSNPVRVAVTPVSSTVDTVQQSVYFVEKRDKPALLEHLLGDKAISRVLVFTRTKHGANKVVTQLSRAQIGAEAIHGNKSQSARERALGNFKAGRTRVLVATDIAARGLDVEDITHVINYDLPNEPETYVHRIGRTARAGASGFAYSFCDTDERAYLKDIEKLIRLRVPVVAERPYMTGSSLPAVQPDSYAERRPSTPNHPGQQPKRFRSGFGQSWMQSSGNGNDNGSPSLDKKRRRRRRRPSGQAIKPTAG